MDRSLPIPHRHSLTDHLALNDDRDIIFLYYIASGEYIMRGSTKLDLKLKSHLGLIPQESEIIEVKAWLPIYESRNIKLTIE